MAQNRNDTSIKSEWLAPDFGEIPVGYSCAITSVFELIQMVRFRSNQTVIEKYNYLVK